MDLIKERRKLEHKSGDREWKMITKITEEFEKMRKAIINLIRINREHEKRIEKLEGPMYGSMIDDEEE